MSYQKEKDARVEMIARKIEEFLCELVKNASEDEWFEIYSAAYDFMDEASINHFSPCDRLVKLDRRPPE